MQSSIFRVSFLTGSVHEGVAKEVSMVYVKAASFTLLLDNLWKHD